MNAAELVLPPRLRPPRTTVAQSEKAMARDLMAREIQSCGGSGGRAVVVWTLSVLLIYVGFRATMENSRSSLPAADAAHDMSSSDRRARLYDKMARDLEEHGAAFLRGGETSQSLSLSDLFSVKDGAVTPTLKPANPPVRANVLYLSSDFAAPISLAVRDVFLPYFDKAIWFQNTSFYHFSLFHASHHLTSVHASDAEIEAEAEAVKAVTKALCPLRIVLDRVVLTSTGVLLGCWQVTSGSDPLVIRTKLRNALPHAPEKQLYDPVILHTSFARLLGPPNIPLEEKKNTVDQLQFFHELVARINKRICSFKASVSELWFVEEFDVLALALNGRMRIHRFNLGCLERDR